MHIVGKQFAAGHETTLWIEGTQAFEQFFGKIGLVGCHVAYVVGSEKYPGFVLIVVGEDFVVLTQLTGAAEFKIGSLFVVFIKCNAVTSIHRHEDVLAIDGVDEGAQVAVLEAGLAQVVHVGIGGEEEAIFELFGTVAGEKDE